MNIPSKLIENAVIQISRLPGIGKKSALRIALHLLKENEQTTKDISQAILNLRTQIQYCKHCQNIADTEICSICNNPKRDNTVVCVVENITDVLAIENTVQYNGLYHVLGGVISPLNGVSPEDLKIEALLNRLPNSEIKEIILALSATMDADMTAFYLSKKLQPFQVKITTIARGVPVGSELEYTDEITLARSIQNRSEYK